MKANPRKFSSSEHALSLKEITVFLLATHNHTPDYTSHFVRGIQSHFLSSTKPPFYLVTLKYNILFPRCCPLFYVKNSTILLDVTEGASQSTASPLQDHFAQSFPIFPNFNYPCSILIQFNLISVFLRYFTDILKFASISWQFCPEISQDVYFL